MAWQCFLGWESKHPSLPLARAERKPLDHKRKHPPRYQREKDFWFSFGTHKRTLALMKKCFNPRHQRARPLKETLALLQERSAPHTSAHTRSKIKEKHLPFCRCSP